MSEKKTNSVLNFIKNNLYYLLIGISLIIVATVIAIVLATSTQKSPSGSRPPQNSESEKVESESESESEIEKPNDSEDVGGNESNKPVDTKIVFAMPVETSNILKNYTSSTVVYNQTLGVYTGHMGIDFGAEAGSEVVAVYTGKIDSITTSYLKGTTITIDHGNGLKSVYNSLDASENLVEGQVVNQGQVIGWVSDNNRQEYKDGPHLHFEVLFDGNRIDPNEYLLIAEK